MHCGSFCGIFLALCSLISERCLCFAKLVVKHVSLSCVWVQVAPPGLTNVQTMACGACSVEHGQKAMFMAFQVSEWITELILRAGCNGHTKMSYQLCLIFFPSYLDQYTQHSWSSFHKYATRKLYSTGAKLLSCVTLLFSSWITLQISSVPWPIGSFGVHERRFSWDTYTTVWSIHSSERS